MTNRQSQIGKFAPNRLEQPRYNPNWWRDLPKTHPLHDPTPARKQLARDAQRIAGLITKEGPNRHERRKQASIVRKAIKQ